MGGARNLKIGAAGGGQGSGHRGQ